MIFFSCVLKEACLTNDLTAHRNNNVDALIREAAEQSTCLDKEMVCCHDHNIELPDEYYDYEINPKCFEYRKEGYRWVFTTNFEYNK